MEKENWIDEVIQSTKGMKPVEANPFLFEKIASKIEQRKDQSLLENSFSKGWVVVAVLLVVVNIVSYTYITKDKPSPQNEMAYAALSKEMGLTSISNY